MRNEIFQHVAELIAAHNDVSIDDITMDSSFEELNMDSLDGITLVNNLEEAYNISIPNEEAVKIRTVRQAVDSLQKILVEQQ